MRLMSTRAGKTRANMNLMPQTITAIDYLRCHWSGGVVPSRSEVVDWCCQSAAGRLKKTLEQRTAAKRS